ncbi:hypothetical protein CP10743SC13_2239 [Chlamydia psittaci 10_743_SC13]|nr:hypothetical protein CP10743SC13_2239 [Chlamydia psittaci 10_743_SC13]
MHFLLEKYTIKNHHFSLNENKTKHSMQKSCIFSSRIPALA